MGFKNTEKWNIIKTSNNIIPRSNCDRRETTHVPVQWSAESWELVFKIRRRLTAHNLMYFQNAPTLKTIR